jgi:dipeptidyl aminopeptidase/acylaminoacyl peptidase
MSTPTTPRQSHLTCIAALLTALCACGDEAGPDDAPEGDPAPAWESLETTKDTATAVIERVSYRSSGLRIWGQVCRPKTPGPHKVLVYTHGGFTGIADGLGIEWNGGMCEALAESGWVVLASSYRGEDGSEGSIEVCLGEVDDALEMTRIGLAQPYADTARVAVLGASHGGCVALRALQRGLPAQVAVDIFGATDWSHIHDYWEALYGTDDATLALLRDAAGGTPAEVPEAYAARSPLAHAADLASWKGSLLCVHGVLDELVPVADTCGLVDQLGGFRSYHVDETGQTVATPPASCESAVTPWLADEPPAAWPEDRYAVFYDGAGHGAYVPIGDALLADAADFLAAKMP